MKRTCAFFPQKIIYKYVGNNLNMKKIIVILSLLVILVSCNEKEFNLNGKWTVNHIYLKVISKKEYTKRLKSDFKKDFNRETDLDYDKYNKIIQLDEGSIYDFQLNDSIEITYSNTKLRDKKSLKTNYALSKDKKKLSIGNSIYAVRINSYKSITLKKVSLKNKKDTLFTTLIKEKKYD